MDMVLVKKSEIVTETLDDIGENNDLKIADVIAQSQGAPFTFGVVELGKSQGVEFDYDNDGAACYMLEGEITLTENLSGKSVKYEPGDIVYIPQKKGLVVTWSTDAYAKFVFVTYPHWR